MIIKCFLYRTDSIFLGCKVVSIHTFSLGLKNPFPVSPYLEFLLHPMWSGTSAMFGHLTHGA